MDKKLGPKEKRKLKKKLGEKCVYCGCSNSLVLTLDHKVPLTRGGADDEKNQQVACWICNQLKGPLTHLEFKTYLSSLKKLHSIAKINITFPPQLTVRFDQNHHPGFVPYKKPSNGE